MAPLRLAILEADTPVPGAVARHENYTGVFTSLLTRAIQPSPPSSTPIPVTDILTITGHHIVDDQVPRTPYPELSSVDAVLISGSKHNAHDHDPWILELVLFTRSCMENRVKVVGVCFGHQIVARALNLKTGPNGGRWEVSVTEIKVTKEGKELFGVDTLKIHQMHRDIIYQNAPQPRSRLPAPSYNSFPPSTVILAKTPLCANQGMYSKDKFITIQGHPEFTTEIMAEILTLRHEGGVLSDEVFESGMQRVAERHDGVAIMRAFLRFLKEGKGGD